MTILNILYVIAAVVFLFGAAIFLHEFGHFCVARMLGMKVEEFAIGMGPKMFSRNRNGIFYSIRWIPAGGFVKLPQMITSEALEGKSEVPVPPAPPLHKILVAFAGPFMNVVFAFAIASVIYFVGLPVAVNPSIIGDVEPGSPEAKLGIHEGDRIIAVNGKLVKSWQDVQVTTAMARTNVMAVTIERAGTKTIYYLAAKINEQVGLKLLDLDPKEHPAIIEVMPGSAAEMAGLKQGDEIMSFAGVPVVGQQQLVSLIKKRPGKSSDIEVIREKGRRKFTVTPKFDPTTKVGLMGVIISPSAVTVYQVQKPGPLPWELVGEVCQQSFSLITALIHSKQTGVGVKNLSGPPGILAMLATQVKTDYRLALKFMVLLNISLAIINLLPVPVLDGGHIAMAILEKLRGRPLSTRIQEIATTAFAFVLISFMVYISVNDLKHFSLFRSMFKQQVQIESGASEPDVPTPAR